MQLHEIQGRANSKKEHSLSYLQRLNLMMEFYEDMEILYIF